MIYFLLFFQIVLDMLFDKYLGIEEFTTYTEIVS